jgi:dTDP-4-amino-4,6-dideoxygalactose transaminase
MAKVLNNVQNITYFAVFQHIKKAGILPVFINLLKFRININNESINTKSI